MVITLRGKIIAYSRDIGAGLIQTPAGQNYYFEKRDWLSADQPPDAEIPVNFECRGRRAYSILKVN